MAANGFLTFADAPGANVLTDLQYAANNARQTGFVKGTAPSNVFNKAQLQSSVIASLIGQFMADFSLQDATDSSAVADLETRLRIAIAASQAGAYLALDTSNVANVLTANLTPAPPTSTGVVNILVKVANTNTGPATINLNGFGAKSIVKRDGTAIIAGDLVGGLYYAMIYDGGNFRLAGYTNSDIHPAPIPYTGGTPGNGQFYTMTLPALQVFTLPNPGAIPAGWFCDLQILGNPSGFQTAYAQIATGSGSTALTYRGISHTPFYLIGGGEILRFYWTGSAFLVLVLGQSTFNLQINMTNSGGANLGGTGSYQYVPINSTTGSNALFNLSSTYAAISVPVSGFYTMAASSAVQSTDSTPRTGSLLLTDANPPTIIYDSTNVSATNNQPAYPKTIGQSFIQQGGGVNVLLNNPSGMTALTTYDTFTIKLANR